MEQTIRPQESVFFKFVLTRRDVITRTLLSSVRQVKDIMKSSYKDVRYVACLFALYILSFCGAESATVLWAFISSGCSTFQTHFRSRYSIAFVFLLKKCKLNKIDVIGWISFWILNSSTRDRSVNHGQLSVYSERHFIKTGCFNLHSTIYTTICREMNAFDSCVLFLDL